MLVMSLCLCKRSLSFTAGWVRQGGGVRAQKAAVASYQLLGRDQRTSFLPLMRRATGESGY